MVKGKWLTFSSGLIFVYPNFLSAFISVNLWLILLIQVQGQTSRIAVLNYDSDEKTQNFAEKLTVELAKSTFFKLLDEDLSEAARQGLADENLFNLSREEARNLGAAIDCDFFFVVRIRIQRRSAFEKNVYFEGIAVIFLVSAKSGRLIHWERVSLENEKAETSEKLLISEITKLTARFLEKIKTAREIEKNERETFVSTKEIPALEEVPDEETAKAQNFRIPLPYKRLRPVYTAEAAKDATEAKVDVLVEIDEQGYVKRAEIERWAGFGLDEAAAQTVKKMQFRSALRDGKPLAVKFLLRYNFRRPPTEKAN